MQLRLLFAAVALLAASSAASAQVVTQVSNQVQPVTINQSSPLNLAAVIQVNGGGPTSATIAQTGTTNGAGILQFGANNNTTIQTGGTNVASVGQTEILNTGIGPFMVVFRSP